MRIIEATSDLYAADAQYHKDCYVNVMPTRNTQAAQYKCNVKAVQGHAFQSVTEVMNIEQKHIWTSIELHDKYIGVNAETNHKCMSSRQLISKVQEYF